MKLAPSIAGDCRSLRSFPVAMLALPPSPGSPRMKSEGSPTSPSRERCARCRLTLSPNPHLSRKRSTSPAGRGRLRAPGLGAGEGGNHALAASWPSAIPCKAGVAALTRLPSDQVRGESDLSLTGEVGTLPPHPFPKPSPLRKRPTSPAGRGRLRAPGSERVREATTTSQNELR